ncbi:hypothetical protein [Chiayiivirga sp.]|nr:hypothetical protein [Chiayiivirga sp.]
MSVSQAPPKRPIKPGSGVARMVSVVGVVGSFAASSGNSSPE